MTNSNSTDRSLRFQVYYSGGPGTTPERYLCSEWATREAAEGWIKSAQSVGQTYEIIDTWAQFTCPLHDQSCPDGQENCESFQEQERQVELQKREVLAREIDIIDRPEPSPTPWRIQSGKGGPGDGREYLDILSGDNPLSDLYVVVRMFKTGRPESVQERDEANAAFIVRACNSYEALSEFAVAMEPYLSTEQEMLNHAAMNEGRASAYDVASIKGRKALDRLKAAKRIASGERTEKVLTLTECEDLYGTTNLAELNEKFEADALRATDGNGSQWAEVAEPGRIRIVVEVY